MKSKQLSMFETEDLPLFSGTAPRAGAEVFDPQPESSRIPLPGMEPAMGDREKYAAEPKKPARPGFLVHLTWQNGGPKMHQAEPTEELAAATMRHWFATMAGVRSITIEDVEQNMRHIFTPAGYMFSVPVL